MEASWTLNLALPGVPQRRQKQRAPGSDLAGPPSAEERQGPLPVPGSLATSCFFQKLALVPRKMCANAG